VRFQFRTASLALDGFRMRFRGVCDGTGGGHAFEFEWPVEFVAGGCRIPVPGAQLWWPRGYGQPNLYTVAAQLCRGDQVLVERVDRVGIRRLVLDRTETAGASWVPRAAADGPALSLSKGLARVDVPPDPGSHFIFSVNGVPIMVKGANGVPLDAFHSQDAGRVDRAVALFDDLGCNMIRCWGGNV
jgi:beta-mannosidase